MEKRKKEFVHFAKRFSNTLKTYFKDQNATQVGVLFLLFVSGTNLDFNEK